MTALAHIGHGIDKKLITAVMNVGLARPLADRIEGQPGILSVTVHHARGTGSRRGRKGRMLWTEKDVLMVLVEAPQAEGIFRYIHGEARLGEPANGLIFTEAIRRGHPMMPFAL